MTSSGQGQPRRRSSLIGALLRLYPRSFREEFGSSVRELAERELATAARAGRMAWFRALIMHALDLILSAAGQRWAALGRAPHAIAATLGMWRRDTHYGARLLAKQRSFSAVVVITLALAIGANTVIFTIVDILVLQPLPVRDPDGLGWIYNVGPQAEGDRSKSSLADLVDFRASSRSFASLAASVQTTLTLSDRGDAERVGALQVTANLFDVWGLRILAGRGFQSGEDTPGAPPVAMLSHQFWQRRFAGDRSVVGRTLVLDGVNHTVVGVLDPSIEIGNLMRMDVWVPLTIDPAGAARDDRRLGITGRLAPGVTHAQANAELRSIAKRLQQQYPQTNNGWDARVTTTHEAITNKNTWIVLALLGLVVAFVLLIACANLANLMLARSAERGREMAVRTALGASRGAIVRQLIVESLILGVIGGIAGVALAYGGLVVLKAVAYEEIFAMMKLNVHTLMFASAITLLTSVAFSLLPAIQTSRADVNELLKAVSGKTTRGKGMRRGRSTLVVSQLALALSLTIVAALVVRSLMKEARIDVGFDTRDLFMFRIDAPRAGYENTGRLAALYEQTLTAVSALRGTAAVGVTNRVPVIGGDAPAPITIEGRVVAKPADQPWATRSAADSGFFEATRIAILDGRPFSRMDNAASPRTAIVSLEMAKRYWGSPRAAIGKRVRAPDADSLEWRTVVGVAADTKSSDITLPPAPVMYIPIAQHPSRTMTFLIRAPNAGALLPDVRAAMRRVDAGLALYQAQTMDQAFKIEMSTNYVLTGMYLAFAAIALSLAAAGLYGVISYSVSQRTREIGIRVALGATSVEVQRLVLAQGARLLIVGGALGIAGAALIANGARALLYGVSPLDPLSYSVVVAVIVVVMGIATYVPARRAVRVDPIRALHSD